MADQSGPSGEQLFDIKAAAEFLDVSTKTIRRYIDADKLKAKKIKNVWKIEKTALEQLVGQDEEPQQATLKCLGEDFFEDLGGTLEEIKKQMGDVERRLYLISKEREAKHLTVDLHASTRKISALTEEKQRLVEENENLVEENERLTEDLRDLKSEMDNMRQSAPKDSQLLKSKTEEIEDLKAVIASNKRGLALLREDVARKDQELVAKDAMIEELKSKSVSPESGK